jgi:hypothetical protein
MTPVAIVASAALGNSFAFGGASSCLVLGRDA